MFDSIATLAVAANMRCAFVLRLAQSSVLSCWCLKSLLPSDMVSWGGLASAARRELYRLVLVDTPLAPYFADTLSSEDLDEMNIEILRNTLYKVCRALVVPSLWSSWRSSSCNKVWCAG